MASLSQPESCAKSVAETERSDPHERPESDQTKKLPEQEYNFIEDLPQDFFCPVTFELLRDPQLTTCCGHILSRRVVTKLQQEGKPCPMCKDPSFPSVPNKHFKRKVEELKVRCSHTRNGCTWEGQLGNLDQHLKSCPKRPWQCQHCDFRGTYDIGTTDHLPNCTKYPEPCPNQCDIGTVPRCDMEKHLTECPLQLVECEFAQAGCREKVPRQDLSRHMEEGAQHHLLSMSLLNLSLTRELHQKMAEKDQQIAELQGELQEQSRTLKEQFQEIKELREQFQRETGNLQHQLALQGKGAEKQVIELQEQSRKLEEQLQEINGLQAQEKQTKQQLETGLTGLQGQIQKLDGKIERQVTDLQQKIQQQITGVEEQIGKKSTEQRKETENQISEMQQHFETQLTGFQGQIDQKVADLQHEIQQQITGVEEQIGKKSSEQHKETEKQISGMLEDVLVGGMQALLPKYKLQISSFVQSVTGFGPPFETTLTEFSVHKSEVDTGDWKSGPFYSHPGGYKFKLNIETNGRWEAQGTHITAWLLQQGGEHDSKLSWPIQVTAHLQLLNQQGDYRHVVASIDEEITEKGIQCKKIARKFIAHSELGYNAVKNTQYLKDNCLHFRLYLKVTHKM